MGIRIGVDIGIASVGAAVVNDEYEVLEAVSNLFESADASKNVERRGARQAKRLLRRRKNRLTDFDKLWEKYNQIVPINKRTDVVELRVKGLKEELTKDEMYFILKYMLKHRGISYLEDADDSKGGSDYKEALRFNGGQLKEFYPCEIQKQRIDNYNQYRGNNTVENEDGSKVHISNVFTTSSYRKELTAIFERQSQLLESIGKDFAEKYLDIWNRKREYYVGPGNDKSRTDYGKYTTIWDDEKGEYKTEDNIFEKLIGKCSIYKDERRAAAASLTAQEFNLLNDLNNITVNYRKLEQDEKEKIIKTVKESDSVNIRKIIKACIGEEINELSGAREDKDGKEEFHKFEQYNKLRKEFTSAKLDITRFSRESFDLIAEILTLNTQKEAIEKSIALNKLDVTKEEMEVLISVRRKNGQLFNKWQSMSLKIMNELIPDLYARPVNQMVLLTEMGVFKSDTEVYKDCKKIPTEKILENIYNPVVNRSIRVAVNVINALIDKYGYPEEIIVEMPRDRNSDEEKKRIQDTQKNNEKELKLIVDRVKNEYGIEIKEEHFKNQKNLVLKLKLWNEQGEKCLYSGERIAISDLLEKPYLFEIDHIIPKSVSFDDSRSNKVLVFADENQEKGNKTPYQYLSNLNREWDFDELTNYALSLRAKNKNLKTKVNNLLCREDITKVEVLKGFLSRNLNDTRYASKVVLNVLQGYFRQKNNDTKIKVIRGSFTHELRNALRLEKDREESFAHHAVDAMIMCYSQMGLETYRSLQEKYIDFENETVLDEDGLQSILSDKEYNEAMYQGKLLKIRKNIREAEGKVKYNHRVDKKCNRGLSNATIYGTRQYDDKICKISTLDIRNDKDVARLRKLLEKNKQEDILMYRNDMKSFEMLMEILNQYRESKNPFVEYEKETGEKIRKYSKKNNGPVIKKIKYMDGEVNSCIDISHKYGFSKDSKRVVLDSLNPYRADVYYNRATEKYYLVGLKYANFKFLKGKYVLDEESYTNVLRQERVVSEKEGMSDLQKKGIEFCFSLYKNDIIYYEKNGEYFKERFLSRTMPQKMNYIEKKPINAISSKERSRTVGLKNSKCIRKINTDILGNEYFCDKEKFNLALDI